MHPLSRFCPFLPSIMITGNIIIAGSLPRILFRLPRVIPMARITTNTTPNWIAGEFGQQAADELDQTLKKMAEQSSAQAKKIVKLVGLVFLVLILFAIVLFVVLKSTLG